MEFFRGEHWNIPGLSPFWNAQVLRAIAVFVVILACFLSYTIASRILLKGLHRWFQKTRNTWDDLLLRRHVFDRLAHVAPALVLFYASFLLFPDWDTFSALIRRVAMLYILAVAVLVMDAFLTVLLDFYARFPLSRRVPIKSFVQVAKILLFVCAVIIALGLMMDREPWFFLSGLGALTAVLLLIFKDAILGLVAGVQLAANNMVRPGDWIEMPQFGADGDVIDVSLTTVKVQNFDKTITTIPTYSLVSDSFRNWRGMQESGGRRIKRAIHIDLNTITFCDEEMLERFRKIQYISEYIDKKREEVREHNQRLQVDETVRGNGRRLTNIGTFRAYVENYLRNHPMVHPDMTFLIRHLPPGEKGLPIEIYVFSRENRWAYYEKIQADIFDHLLAVVPEFDLRVFQEPSGQDMRALADNLKALKPAS